MLEEVISVIEAIEHSIVEKKKGDLEARLALRVCLKELRDCIAARTQSGLAPYRPVLQPT